jgi:hypothetical protein
MKILRHARPLLAISAFLLALVPSQLSADVITYQFTGDCKEGDCTGTGIGMLTLSSYNLGDEIFSSNFVSFTYHSNLIDISVTPATLTYIDGFLFGPMPLAEYVFIRGSDPGALFNSSSSQSGGSWCGGTTCAQDNGPTSTWTTASVDPVPEPAMFLPIGGAMLAFGLIRRRRA